MKNIQQGFIVPVYNHGNTLEKVIESLLEFNLPIIVVDDGNNDDEKKYINEVSQKYSCVTVLTNSRNRGKGDSVWKGVQFARQNGITHLFQIDADGQHDTTQCKKFLSESLKNPDAVVCGYPTFDESVPLKRLNGRKISNIYASFVTLTKNYIKDSMCGYRIYPVETFYKIWRHSYMDSRMAFDTEILVRYIWKNIPLIFFPVRVSYPEGGKSNFRMFRDNVRISWMFIRMTFGMIFRLPILLFYKIQNLKK